MRPRIDYGFTTFGYLERRQSGEVRNWVIGGRNEIRLRKDRDRIGRAYGRRRTVGLR